MSSSRVWLILLLVIGMLSCYESSSQFYLRNSAKVPINYKDGETNRYDNEEIEYDIMDQKHRMWGEEDHVIRLSQPKVTQSPNRKGIDSRFTTARSRSVIPDQNELDQVDEDALKRGHEEITVDKDDEVITEIIEEDAPSKSIPLTSESSLKNSSKAASLTDKIPQNTEPTIINRYELKSENFFSDSRNKTANGSSAKQRQNFSKSSTENKNLLKYTNSLETAQMVGDNSSNFQSPLNKSLPKIVGGKSNEKSVTSQVQLLGLNASKVSTGKNLTTANQVVLDLDPVASTQNSHSANRTSVGSNLFLHSADTLNLTDEQNDNNMDRTLTAKSGNTSANVMPSDLTVVSDATNLTDEQNNYNTTIVKTLKAESSDTSSTVMPEDLTEVVDNKSDNIFFKANENAHNVSGTRKSQGSNNTDVESFIVKDERPNTTKQQSFSNITVQVPQTSFLETQQSKVLKTNDTKSVVSSDLETAQQNISSPILDSALSKMKNRTIDKLDKRLDILLSFKRDKNRAKEIQEQQKMESFGVNTVNGTRSLLPTSNFRRMTIIHQNTSLSSDGSIPHKQSKASHKLQSFLTAVKEMFKEPETAEDIMAWESWVPCSKTCGKGAVRTRQRRCGRLVLRGFDVACPEPKEERQKCPIVSCIAKSKQKPFEKSLEGTKIESNSLQPVIGDNDQNHIERLGKPLVQGTDIADDKFSGNKQNEETSKEEDGDSSASGINNEEQTEGEAVTEGYDGPSNGYDGTSEEYNPSNVASAQTANQKHYLYTVWGSWSACTRTCGQRAYAFRKRYCINAVNGEIRRHCQRPTILAKKCVLIPCPVDGGLSGWSKWSSCSGTCGIMERHRSCTNPKPAYGGKECFKLPVQIRLCGTCSEDEVAAVQKLASYSPQSLCGFDPCRRVGCLEDKGAICVTDFECNPTFFDDEGKVLKRCKDSAQLFLRPLAQKKCSFNPCSFAKCDADGAKCLVDTKCRPLFVDELGKRVRCRGSNVLQISSELICGFNPCKITTCTVDPDAKCVTDYRCNPLFINSAGQKISGCTEDEVEEAERLTTERPTESQQKTENSFNRDKTPAYPFNPYLQQHNMEKYRDEQSAKKTIEDIHKTNDKLKSIKQLENILANRLHQRETINFENIKNPRNSEHVQQSTTDESRNSSENHGNERLRTLDIKLLELILRRGFHQNNSLDSKSPTVSKKVEEFQDKKAGLEKDSQHLSRENSNGTSDKTSTRNPNQENKITVKTVHQSNDETTEITDSPSLTTEPLTSMKNNGISTIQELVDKPFPNKNRFDPIEKPSESKSPTDQIVETNSSTRINSVVQASKQSNTPRKDERQSLADVDRFILDKLYQKKMMEDADSASLESMGGGKVQGKVALNAIDVVRNISSYKILNEFKSKDRETGYKNVYNSGNDSNDNNKDKNDKNSNTRNVNDKLSMNDSINNNIKIDTDASDNPNDMFSNTEENTMNSSASDAMSMENESNEMLDNYLTAKTANNNHENSKKNNNNNNNSDKTNDSNSTYNYRSRNNDNQSNDRDNHIISNLNFVDQKNQFNASMKINLKTLSPPAAISSTTQYPKRPLQNHTQNYNLGLFKLESSKTKNIAASLDTKLGTHANPQMPKTSGETHGEYKDDNTLAMLWRNYLANLQNVKEVPASFKDAGKMTSNKPKFDYNETEKHDYDSSDHKGDVKIKTGKMTVSDGSELVQPGHKGVKVVGETGTSGKEGDRVPVILSSDPNFQISPYDEDVTSSAIEKEQSENPKEIKSNDELNRILNLASGTKLNGGSQVHRVGHVLPQFNREEHKRPSVSSSQPLSQDKPVKHVTVNASQSGNADVINKLILKAVQQEIAKLGVDEILKNSLSKLKNSKLEEHGGLDDPSVKPSLEGYFGVTKKPIDDQRLKGLYLKKGEQFVTARPSGGGTGISMNQSEQDMNRPLPGIEKPRDNGGYKGVFIKEGEKGNSGNLWVTAKPIVSHSYVGISNGHHMLDSEINKQRGGKLLFMKPKQINPLPTSTTMPIFEEEKESHLNHEQSREAGHTSHQETESVHDFLKNQGLFKENIKTSPKPEQTTNSPAENNKSDQMVESPNYYTVSISPTKGKNSFGHARVTEATEGFGSPTMEPEYKESYPPSLVDEIKELGLHEYFIKDGFQTSGGKHRKLEDGQARQILKSHRWESNEDSDSFNYKYTSHPAKYGKKFHLAKIETLPDENGHSALRQHNSNGDEIERVPNSYREGAGVARSHTTRKNMEETLQPNETEDNYDFPKEHGASDEGSLTKYLDHLRRYIGNMDGDLLESGLKAQDKHEATEEDLRNAIILTAKDDEDSQSDIEDSENRTDESEMPRIHEQNPRKNSLLGNDVLTADDDESNKNEVMVFKASDEDDRISEYKKRTLGNLRRTLGMQPKHLGIKTHNQPR